MKKHLIFIISVLFFINFEAAHAIIYECTYNDEYGNKIVTSFNPVQKTRSDYKKVSNALKTGNCKELKIKKYLINYKSCNIQFYKYNGKIAGMACSGGDATALEELKEIARRDFGYIE